LSEAVWSSFTVFAPLAVSRSTMKGMRPKTERAPLPAIADAFLLDRKTFARSFRPTTERNYREVLDRFFARHAEVTTQTIQQYLAYLQDRVNRQQIQAISAHKDYRVLKTFCKWAKEAGAIERNPLAEVTRKRPKVFARKAAESLDEVRALVAACPKTWHGRRNRAMVLLVADGAYRRLELHRLSVQDVHFGTRTLDVRGKGDKDRQGWLTPNAVMAIKEWLTARGQYHPEDWLFCNEEDGPLHPDTISHVFQKLSVKAGLRIKRGPHAFRHFAATHVAEKTGDVWLVRDYLGHSRIRPREPSVSRYAYPPSPPRP
jgi:integrase/recombinase XerD